MYKISKRRQNMEVHTYNTAVWKWSRRVINSKLAYTTQQDPVAKIRITTKIPKIKFFKLFFWG